MTETPAIFGENRPFTLIHAEDLAEVTRFLSAHGVESTVGPGGPSLFKVQFTSLSGEEARALISKLVGRPAEERARLV